MPDNLKDFLDDDVPVRARKAVTSKAFQPKVTENLRNFLTGREERPELEKVTEGTGGALQPILPFSKEETEKKLTEQGFELDFINFDKKLNPVPIDYDQDKTLANPVTIGNKEVPTTGLTEYDILLQDTPLGKRVMRADLQVKVPEPLDMKHWLNTVAKSFGHSAVNVYQSLFTASGYIGEAIKKVQELGMFLATGEELELTDVQPLIRTREFTEEVERVVTDAFDSYLPTQDDNSFWGTKFPSGVGSMLFFLAGGAFGKVLGASGKISSVLLGAGTESQQMYEDAVRSGATEGEILANYLMGGGLGATEGVLGIGAHLDKLGKLSGKSIIRQFMTGSVEEWFQETVQTIGQNATVQMTYDLSRSLLQDVPENGAIALMLGGLTSGGIAGINKMLDNGKNNKGEPLTDDERVLLQQARNNFDEVTKRYTIDKLQEGTGQQHTDFFTAKSEKASSEVPYKPTISIDVDNNLIKDFDKYTGGGNFSGHIAKMIPAFLEKQVSVVNAIVKGNYKKFLDIGTSEGGMLKTVSKNSNTKSVGIDPNSQMKENFNKTEKVEGAEFRQEAFQSEWTDPDGTKIKEFKTQDKFDVINEDFAFQFMNANRRKQVQGVKKLLTKKGVFVTSEKFHTANQEQNEQKKNEYQKQYFKDDQLTEDQQTIIEGMDKGMVSDVEYFEILKENFGFVEEFYNAGNFKGYIASDNQAELQKFKDNVGDLSNPYQDNQSLTREGTESQLQTESEVQKQQNEIPSQHKLPLYHFSSNIFGKDVNQKRSMVTDPHRFASNAFTKGDAQQSPEPRTFFFIDPKDVQKDADQLQRGSLYIGVADARKIYNLSQNAQQFGFEDGAFSIDRALQEAKNAGWQGVRYDLGEKTIVNMFKPVYVERPDATPSMGEIVSGRWDATVMDAKHRLNSGFYGKQLYDATTIPLVGSRLVSDVGIIMADEIVNGEGKRGLGTPKEFAVKLLEKFGDDAPIVRRFAREIYEYANSIIKTVKANPLTKPMMDEVKYSISTHLQNGETGEYIPTGKGAIILGGDIADFEGGERKHIGIDFPKGQAMQRIRAKDGTIMKTVAIKDIKTGKVYQGESNMHFMLIQELEREGKVTSEEEELYQTSASFLEDGFVDFDNKFYTRDETEEITGAHGESFAQGIAEGTDLDTKTGRKRQAQLELMKEKSYPVWATQQGVAKQISNSATVMGNDTLIFMVYPQAWNSVKDNYAFHEELNYLLSEELEFGDIPRMPNLEAWTVGAVQTVRKKYIKEVKDAIGKIKKSKVGREAQSKWNLDTLAYKFGIENGINLTGKIKGVAKFKNINQDLSKEGGRDERKAPHRLYDTEIEGYNYQELDEPIDYNFVKEETKGSDVGNQGKIKEMTGNQKELLRRNQMWRNIHQRGQTITQGQSELVDALILHSEGDQSALNSWLQDNPNSKGEIVDEEAHEKWRNKNKKVVESLRQEANKSLADFIKENQTKQERGEQGDVSMVAMAGMPPINPDFWKSLGIIGKAMGRGAKGFTNWASSMVKALGEWVKPLLRNLYAYVNQLPNMIKPVSKKKIDYEVTKDNTTDPVVEEEINKRRQHPKGTLPSMTKGYNMEREHPNLSNIMQPAIDAMRKEFDVRRRGTVSNEDLLEVARRNAESLTEIDVWDIKKGDVRNAEDILALRLFITDKMLKVADDLKALKKEDGVLRIKDMSDQLVEVMRMWQVVRGVGTELGRGVQSFNIPMSDEIISSFINAVDVINGIDPDNKMGGGIIKEMMEDMAKLKTDTPQKKQTVWEWTRYIFLNWILQNPLTDMANIGGNISNLGFHIFANTDEFLRERSLLKGIRMGVREGRQNAIKVLHGEQEAISKFTEGSQIEMPSAKQRSWKNYFKLLVPTTRLGIEDAFFRAMAKNVETQRMVKKTGRELGVAPDDVYNAVNEIINDPEIAKFERKEYRDLVNYLEKIEDQLVFQQELGTVGKGLSKVSRIAFPIIPFVTTPTNILRAGVGASPLGFSKLLWHKDVSKEERGQIIRKALAGSVVLSGVAALIAQGLVEITGNGSDDAFERDLMAEMGYKPNHLYINTPFGKWGGSYMNVNPMNTVFSIMGDMFDKYRFKKFSKDPESDLQWYNQVAQDLSTALLAIGKSVTEQSYLRGVREMMDAFSGRNPDWFMRILTGYARVGVIQGIQRIAGVEDRGRYVTRGRVEEQVQKNFPLTSNEGLIESVSAFGKQRVSQFERFPFPFTKVEDKTPYTWMEREGLTLTIPSRGTKLGNRQMNRKEYEMFAKGVGRIMDSAVQQLWQNQTDPELDVDKKLSLEEMQDKLDSVYNKARDAVKKKIKEAIFKQLNEGLK